MAYTSVAAARASAQNVIRMYVPADKKKKTELLVGSRAYEIPKNVGKFGICRYFLTLKNSCVRRKRRIKF